MATAERDATYTMGRSEGETERLIEQAHLYEKMTLRMLGDAGVVLPPRVTAYARVPA